jgi:protein-S-isoprenylcysteine O-methyltransferase Ste14
VVSSLFALSLLWIGWLLSWVLASGWTAKTVTQQSAGSRIAQSLPIWIGAILLFRPARGIWAAPLLPSVPWIGSIALLLAALGFATTWWARIHLGRLWSSAVTLKSGHQLVRSGPYAITRHPIYSGLLLALFATAIAHDSLGGLLGVGLILLGLVFKLRLEEQFLETQFGAAYDAYKKDVPALIPRLW